MRKKALVEAGSFDETLNRRQDFDLILRLSVKHVCMTTDRVLWVKHEAPDSISRNVRTYLAAAISICERHPNYLRDHPEALYRDLRSHFSKLLKRREWKVLRVDARRYRAYQPLEVPLLRLLLDPRVSRVGQIDSVQRSRNESGTPSKIADNACADASVKQYVQAIKRDPGI